MYHILNNSGAIFKPLEYFVGLLPHCSGVDYFFGEYSMGLVTFGQVFSKVPFTLHPWIKRIYTNTNAKEQKKCPSVSFQKRALKLVLRLPE